MSGPALRLTADTERQQTTNLYFVNISLFVNFANTGDSRE